MSSESKFSAQELLDAGRSDAPTAADRARIRSGLDRRLLAPRVPRAVAFGGPVAIVALAATIAWLTWPRAPKPRATPAPTPPVAAAAAAPAPTTAETLAEETRLLREAQQALAVHDGEAALRALDEHARRFPQGLLGEEREAARVVALCERGDVEQARAAADAFLQATPRSPQAARVRGSCAFK